MYSFIGNKRAAYPFKITYIIQKCIQVAFWGSILTTIQIFFNFLEFFEKQNPSRKISGCVPGFIESMIEPILINFGYIVI